MTGQTTTENPTGFWAIVEQMGHIRFAGFVTEQQLGSGMILRLDVPEVKNAEGQVVVAAFTKFIGNQSIYSITQCSEEAARRVASHIQAKPVSCLPPYVLPQPQWKSLPAAPAASEETKEDEPDEDDDDDDGDDDDEDDEGDDDSFDDDGESSQLNYSQIPDVQIGGFDPIFAGA